MRLCVFLLVISAVSLADKEREIDGAAARLGRHQHQDALKETDHEEDHQAILGSRKNAEIFDHLPADESKRRLRIIANKMDTNKDGFVDERELTEWVENSLRNLDNEESAERMKEIDVNGDGFVSWEEYLEDSFPDQDIAKLDSDDRKLLREDEIYFRAADIDRDGKLNSEELSAFLNPENYPHMHQTLVAVTLIEKDANGDNAIDLNEFLGEMAEQPKSEWYEVEKTRFVNDYDLNKDGLLTGDEIRRWLIPDLKAVAAQEAQHLLHGADANKDKLLDMDEIVKEYKLFVGSEATNYGEDLYKTHHDEF